MDFSLKLLRTDFHVTSTHTCAKSFQLSALCDPMDCSLPGSSVHRILQARILEWVAISFSRASSQPQEFHLMHWQTDSLSLSHPGSSD